MTLGAKTIESVCELCEAEGYPYNEETCKNCEYNPNREHETITFKYVRAVSLCTVEVYTCSNCERYVCQGGIMDFNYCPYCGRPVVEREDAK